jgi:serine phosphatase RsbU (regulator of sigma subunit)
LDLAANVYPAATIGGDHVDVLRRPDGEAWVVVGDVSGHGFGSALLMAETLAYVRAFAFGGGFGQAAEPGERCFGSRILDDSSFVTLLLVAIDPYKHTYDTPARATLRFSQPPFGRGRADLGEHGPALGIFPDRQFSSGASVC